MATHNNTLLMYKALLLVITAGFLKINKLTDDFRKAKNEGYSLPNMSDMPIMFDH